MQSETSSYDSNILSTLQNLSENLSRLENRIQSPRNAQSDQISEILNRIELQEARTAAILHQQFELLSSLVKSSSPSPNIKNPFIKASQRKNFPDFNECIEMSASSDDKMFDLSETLEGISLVDISPSNFSSSKKDPKTRLFLEKEKEAAERYFTERAIKELQTPAKNIPLKFVNADEGAPCNRPLASSAGEIQLEYSNSSFEKFSDSHISQQQVCMADIFEEFANEPSNSCIPQDGVSFENPNLQKANLSMAQNSKKYSYSPGFMTSPIHSKSYQEVPSHSNRSQMVQEKEVQTDWSFHPQTKTAQSLLSHERIGHVPFLQNEFTPLKHQNLGRPPKSPIPHSIAKNDTRTPQALLSSIKRPLFSSPEMSPISVPFASTPMSKSFRTPHFHQLSPVTDEEDLFKVSSTPHKHVHFADDNVRLSSQLEKQQHLNATPENNDAFLLGKNTEETTVDREAQESTIHTVRELSDLSIIASDDMNFQKDFSLSLDSLRKDLNKLDDMQYQNKNVAFELFHSTDFDMKQQDTIRLQGRTYLVENEADGYEMNKWLGHESLKTPIANSPSSKSNFSGYLQEAVSVGVVDRDVQFEYARARAGNKTKSPAMNQTWAYFQNNRDDGIYSENLLYSDETSQFNTRERLYSPLKMSSSLMDASKHYRQKISTPVKTYYSG